MTVAIDGYISDLCSRLHVGACTRVRIEAEIRDHLDDAIDQRMATGITSDAAEKQAVAEFGSASELATQFNVVTGTQAMRRAPLIVLGAGVAVFAGLLLAATTQPYAGPSNNADVIVQIAFFAAVLAFQVAFVAGARAASRAAALWRSRCVGADDRSFVRRCTAIAIGALAVAAAGWATAVGLSLNRMPHSNTLTPWIGVAAMIVAVIAAAVFVMRLRVNTSDEWVESDADTDDHCASVGLLGLGDRAIEIVRRHPIRACGVIAAVSAAAAMSRAETTFTGALPWGVAQVAVVVGSFVLLGPALRLSRTDRA